VGPKTPSNAARFIKSIKTGVNAQPNFRPAPKPRGAGRVLCFAPARQVGDGLAPTSLRDRNPAPHPKRFAGNLQPWRGLTSLILV